MGEHPNVRPAGCLRSARRSPIFTDGFGQSGGRAGPCPRGGLRRANRPNAEGRVPGALHFLERMFQRFLILFLQIVMIFRQILWPLDAARGGTQAAVLRFDQADWMMGN